ncbi:MAG TPA: DUF6790 family protein [Xanthobacteraceae bacterium]|nr:DUF6790 family protein [Xanthobacteraceae bacterium]
MVVVVPLLAWAAALAAAGVAVARGPRPVSRAFVIERLLRYLFFFPVGLMGLWAFMGHVFVPEEAARGIGWMPSPFQREVGMANLGIGIAGIAAAFRGRDFRLATAIVTACFLIGAGIGHIYEIAKTGNLAPGNAGPILFTDFLTPLALIVLLSMERSDPAKGPAR